MKITTETSAKELKMIADTKGIEYNKNATAAQMQELLYGDTPEKTESKSDDIDTWALLRRLNELENLVRTTWDLNKIKDFELETKKFNTFAFSLKLFPTDDGQLLPIIKWRTVINQVRLWETKVEANQIIEITYLTKDWKEETQKLELVDFSRHLKRSPKIIAKSLVNLDGTNVYVSKMINPETKMSYYLMKPEEQTFNVTLNYEGQELTILSDYLNA